MDISLYFHRKFVMDVIQLYKELPCLWKLKDPDYHDKTKRDWAWEQLVDLFKRKDINADKDIVKRKIESMRSCYRKEYNKVKTSLKYGADVHVPKLWYYNLLTFLTGQMRENTPGTMESALDSIPFGLDEDCEEDLNVSVSVPSASNSATKVKGSSQAKITRQSKPYIPKVHRVLEKISRQLDKPLEKQQTVKQKDKHDIFGKCVDEKLRSLPSNMASYCRNIITEAISLAETGNLNIFSEIVSSRTNSNDINSVT